MKKLIAVFLAILIVFPIGIISFAEELDLPYNSAGSTAIAEHTVESVYTVTIPSYIQPVESGKTSDVYCVTVKDVLIADNKVLNVTVDYNSVLTDARGAELQYSLNNTDNTVISSGALILSQEAGYPDATSSAEFTANLTEDVRFAGVYTDTVIFKTSVDERVYTIEEIDADEHLVGIGRTKSEYVLAQFNDDYTSAVVFKNGEDSDGKMQGWNHPTSPFSEHGETLTTVTVKTGVKNIGPIAFMNCSNMAEISLPDGIEEIGSDAFNNCSALQSIYLSDDIQQIHSYAFMDCTALEKVILPKDLSEISDGVFTGCSNLTSIIIGDKVTKIGLGAFTDCSRLKSIDLPPNLQFIDGWAFSSCKSLEHITIPDSVKTLGGLAFRECRSLAEIHLPAGITELTESLFYNCKKLKQIDIPLSVKKIGAQSYWGCQNI
ncbi:MAG: leucine-rich repeat domain-containing protein, partial [Oscillospiraceae bacterium]|nr:leucine-rich repeat domain-containing protein [Oscillospiraceae bacterium]